MPTYGYRCPKCSLEFEMWQRMSDEPVATCPSCGSPGKRLFFPAGIVFKGSGFYKTDSRKTPSDGAAPAAKPSTASGSGAGTKDASTSTTSSNPSGSSTTESSG